MDWINLAQDTDPWRALVNTAKKLSFIKGGKFLDEMSVLFATQRLRYLRNRDTVFGSLTMPRYMYDIEGKTVR